MVEKVPGPLGFSARERDLTPARSIAGAIITQSPDDRNRLERGVSRARKLVEEEFAATAAGRFGLHASGRIEEEAARRLSPAERDARRAWVGAVGHLRAAGRSPKEAVARLLREAAVTRLNRLVAIRVGESRGTGTVPTRERCLSPFFFSDGLFVAKK
jgi:hypothetical protein